jgi:hypothetical protein
LGTIAVVCARDFPHAPELGLDGGVITEHMRRARDGRVQYIIFNRRITGVNYGWQWQTYTGSDPHDTHFHVSSVHTVAADGTQAWSLPSSGLAAASERETDMPIVVKFSDGPATFITDGVTARWLPDGNAVAYTLALAKNDWLELGNSAHPDSNGNPTVCVLGPEQKGTLGRIVGPVPAGFEAYGPQSGPAVEVDAAAVAAALIADPAFGQLIEDRAFAADQHAEHE